MFREMRLKEQQLDKETTENILKNCTNGILCLHGNNGYPYGVPVSYAYADGKIYFHCAKEGYKVDLMKANDHVAFTVVAQDKIIPDDFNTLFVSAMAFGKVKLVDEPDIMRKIHAHIVEKYSKGYETSADEYLDRAISDIYMGEITIDHVTGKKGV